MRGDEASLESDSPVLAETRMGLRLAMGSSLCPVGGRRKQKTPAAAVENRLGRVTGLAVAHGAFIFIRTCQHIDGWTDMPKAISARVPAPTP